MAYHSCKFLSIIVSSDTRSLLLPDGVLLGVCHGLRLSLSKPSLREVHCVARPFVFCFGVSKSLSVNVSADTWFLLLPYVQCLAGCLWGEGGGGVCQHAFLSPSKLLIRRSCFLSLSLLMLGPCCFLTVSCWVYVRGGLSTCVSLTKQTLD